MEKIYIAFVDTPGLFASALHGYLKQKYIHVVLSLDENLDEAYSFGRRNPAAPHSDTATGAHTKAAFLS